MSELGIRFFEGPSLLTGDPIVGVITGLDKGSHNRKTGAVAQAWVIRADQSPQDAKRQNRDDAVCGDCQLRGQDGRDSKCYVPGFVPGIVYRHLEDYPTVSWPELHAVMEGRTVRVCAYGDPAAIAFEIWQQVLSTAAGWVGYSHAWRYADPRFKTLLMASVDTEDEFVVASLSGWRTFRIRMPGAPLIAGAEFACPASDEMQHRVSCVECQLCRGTSSPARSVAIVAHGKPSSLKAFGIHVPFFKRKQVESNLDSPQPWR